ncbi:MSCRAMM family protein [Levilactobacillus spicheri]|uniref:Gram-positive cocci surface proteins LPxTG domain-containing protein n=1 Tax=Levilactobacillus spicheri TaxID=216463 RepID=A0A0F3RPX0_9LACO|nr:SpaA isopeptide-forming pilin-related protein [Levilactobacillus spicheri]KJW12073.1 hypothetical protein VC81_10500 [Levilactobacillus spicheri]
MRKFVYALLVGLSAVLFGVLLTAPVSGRAATVAATGLTAGDATVTDAAGNNVSANTSFNKWQDYQVSYDWAVPDGVSVSGNTAAVTLPNGLEAAADLTVPITDDTGKVVGSFTIQAGQKTGTITFNDAGEHAINRHGTLKFYAKGTTGNQTIDNTWNVNKIGWISNQGAQGVPTQLTWNVAFNAKSANIGSITITDTLGPNQKFNPGSVVANTGSYDDSGNFIPDGGKLTPTVTTDGSKITFTFSDVKTAVDMTYTTTPTIAGNSATWTNTAATSNGGSVDASVSWGGNGTGTGEGLGSVILNKTGSDGKQLAGALYKLIDNDANNVMYTELATDANGQITLKGMKPGNYSLVEVQAPTGYSVNPTPINFTVQAGVTTPLELHAVDTPDTSLGGGGEIPKGSVYVTKTGVNGALLPGAVFNLLDADNQVVKAGLTTDEKGQFVVTGLTAGNYSLVETQAPDGYELATKPISFTIPADGTSQNVAVTDVKAPETGGSVTPPTNPGEPGVTTPPTTNPGGGNPSEPGNPEPPVTNPGEPGTTTPPTTTPGEPGTTTPPTTNPGGGNPSEPGNPEPPVTNPGGPQEPGTTEPGTTTPTEPGQPTPPVTNPGAPQEPGTAEPGTSEPGTSQPGGTTPGTAQPGTPTPNPAGPTTGGNGGATVPSTAMPGQSGQTGVTGGAVGSGTGDGAEANGAVAGNGTSVNGLPGNGAAAAATLPQTNDQPAPIAVIIGVMALLGLALFGWYRHAKN